MFCSKSTILALVAMVTCCYGYSLGPPLESCQDMFPTGHDVAARTDEPPFTFSLNATTYNPGDTISVFVNTSGDWFMEGALIQVRSVNCSNVDAFGTFTAEDGDPFLQKFNCFGRAGSALRHYSHLHIYNLTFTWTAPSTASGHLYIRATLARNKAIFWTDVYSDYIMDNNDTSTATRRCPTTTEISSAYFVTSSVAIIVACVAAIFAFVY